MDAAQELEAIRRRLDIALAHLEGKGVSEIARVLETSRPTVRKWIARFHEAGVEGLLSKKAPGRPREIHPAIRAEVVRLARETRPPEEIGDQWTARTLGDVFNLSPSTVSAIWKEADFDPPQHIQQVRHNPDRDIPVTVRLILPAWYKMHLELPLDYALTPRRQSLSEVVWEAITGPDPLEDSRESIQASLEWRWFNWLRTLPRTDPRSRDYWLDLLQVESPNVDSGPD